jgi:hypothetical protein
MNGEGTGVRVERGADPLLQPGAAAHGPVTQHALQLAKGRRGARRAQARQYLAFTRTTFFDWLGYKVS